MVRDGSKKAIVLEPIRRYTGASLQELVSATGWEPAHTVRDLVSGSLGKRTGITADSSKRRTGIGPTRA
jgi:Protein of unknown function (DUF3489)